MHPKFLSSSLSNDFVILNSYLPIDLIINFTKIFEKFPCRFLNVNVFAKIRLIVSKRFRRTVSVDLLVWREKWLGLRISFYSSSINTISNNLVIGNSRFLTKKHFRNIRFHKNYISFPTLLERGVAPCTNLLLNALNSYSYCDLPQFCKIWGP